MGRGLGVEDIRSLCGWATEELWPDVAILLDVPAHVTGERRREPPDRMESAGDEFHARVADGFRPLAAEEPTRWLVVDGTGSVDAVADRVRDRVVDEWLADRAVTLETADLYAAVVGQERALRNLRAAARAPVHAYLFVGPSGVGMREAVRAFAADVLCPTRAGAACARRAGTPCTSATPTSWSSSGRARRSARTRSTRSSSWPCARRRRGATR